MRSPFPPLTPAGAPTPAHWSWRARLCVACLCALLAARTASAAEERPDILFILSDDQRADTIAALGNAHIRTPNLDRLVAQGTTFMRNYYMGGNNPAVCAPSRAMIMSARTLFRVREDLANIPTWPERFTAAGYDSFATGKWHNGEEALLRSFAGGNALFLGGMGDPYHLPLVDIGANHHLGNQRLSIEHSVALFADAAIAFLQRPAGDRPRLCYVAFNCPHDPRTAPAAYHQPYNADQPPLPADFLPLHPFDNGEMTIRDEHLAPWPRTPAVIRQNLADYYSYITYMDEQIGRILAALQASGRADRTIIVFSSDNGLAIGSHGLMGKQNLYEHSVRLPLIISGPGIPKGRSLSAFTYLIDIFPTLGEYAGVAAPTGSEGSSLVPLLRGTATTVRDSVFSAYKDVQRAVRDERWKLIDYPQINQHQLFDLQADPNEMHDLATDPQRAGETARMTALLTDWQRRLGDTQPLTVAKPAPAAFDFGKLIRDPQAKALE